MGVGSTNPFDMSAHDEFHEECGLVGVFASDDDSILTALGLHALQHRGQEAAGIVTFDGQLFHVHRALGHVGDNFGADSPQMARLRGHAAIGDVARNEDQPQFCDAFFTGDYPIRLASGLSAKRVSHGGSK